MSEAEERPTAEMISKFWDRWMAVKDDLATAMLEFRTEEYAPSLAKIVETLHPGLRFALQAGLSSRNALAFSGDPDAEWAVRRLLDAAPQPDEVWEYTDLISGPGDVRELVWVVDDLEVRMSEALAQFVEAPRELMVAVYHPLWSRLAEEEVFEIVAGTLDRVCASALDAGYEVRGGPIPEEPRTPLTSRNASAASSNSSTNGPDYPRSSERASTSSGGARCSVRCTLLVSGHRGRS